MSAHCNHHHHDHDTQALASGRSPAYRRVLWIALGINAAMFLLEVAVSARSGSVSLLADAIDFFSDAFNYALTLAVLSLALAWRARAAAFKAVTMLLLGVAVLGRAAWAIHEGRPPEALEMGLVGLLALLANVAVAVMLYAYREGDANMRGVWLCTRNDAIGNVAVMLAALGVFGTGAGWPDVAVAVAMGMLALSAGWSVLRQARAELAQSAGG